MLTANLNLSGPDSYGDFSPGTCLEITNEGSSISAAVRTCCAVTRGTTVVAIQELWQTLALDPGEKTEDVYSGLVGCLHQTEIGTVPSEVRLHAFTTLYTGAEFDLGRFSVPPDPSTEDIKSIPGDLGDGVEVVGAHFYRGEPDSDGDVRLKAGCAIRNLGVSAVDRIEIQMDLLSRTNACLVTDTRTVSLKGHSIARLECSVMKKPKEFRQTQVQVILRVFRPFQRDSAIAVATMEDNSET